MDCREATTEAAAAAADRDEQDELLNEIFNTLPAEIAEKRAVIEIPTPKPKPAAPVVEKGVEDAGNVLEDWSVDDWDADLSDDDEAKAEEANAVASDDVAAPIDQVEVEEESESARAAALELSRQLREQLQKQMRSSAYKSKLTA